MEATLRQLLVALGELVDVVLAPAGPDTPITGTAIVDPDDEPDDHAGRLVFVIGVRGRGAVHAVRAVARRGAAVVAVKSPPAAVAELRAAAVDAGVALLAVREDTRWDRLEQLARTVLDEVTGDDDPSPGDLYALAQTIGLLTHGLVSIEDTASRVLAYSRSDGPDTSDGAGPDELRRLSILGWQGPPAYLRMLREWGVFDRLRAGEEVVRVEEHAELGIRRRLAVGIHAGARQLGTIWVQEGAEAFADRAESVLLGAARVAAGHLIRRRHPTGARWSHDLVAGLLDGRVSPGLVATTFGVDPGAPVIVVGFAVRTGEGASHEFGVAELVDIVSVHAATYRRGALTTSDGAHVYALLPGVPRDRVEPALRAMCAEVAALTLGRTGVRVQAGIGSAVAGLAEVPVSRAEADRVLHAMGDADDVAALADLRAEILLDGTLGLLAAAPDLHDPAVARLVAHDAEHGTDLAVSVLAYLDALGDVRAAAARLTVHPNTLRYRLRRAAAVAGLELDDPRARLVHHLHLLLAVRPVRQADRADAVRSDDTRGAAHS